MVLTLRSELPTARKTHHCSVCGGATFEIPDTEH